MDVDSVLYGYIKNWDKRCNGYVILNLRIGDFFYGKYKYIILCLLIFDLILFLF